MQGCTPKVTGRTYDVEYSTPAKIFRCTISMSTCVTRLGYEMKVRVCVCAMDRTTDDAVHEYEHEHVRQGQDYVDILHPITVHPRLSTSS